MAALVLAGCGPTQAAHNSSAADAKDWCENFSADFDRNGGFSDLINQATGRLDRNGPRGEITYPGSSRVALTRTEEECIRDEAQKAIDRYEGKNGF